MIARIVIPLLLVIVLSDLYIDVHYFRRRYSLPWWLRLLWWVPCIALSTYTITLASLPSFAPSDLAWLNTYLLLLGFFVGPKAIFALCSFLGSCLMRLTGWPRINLGHYIGILLGCGGVLAYIYGLTVGVRQVKVNHLTLQFEDLPAAFDGYKILHISDLHLGTFYGWRQKILQAEMDSIARQHADLMVFTGDVQNIRPPGDLSPHRPAAQYDPGHGLRTRQPRLCELRQRHSRGSGPPIAPARRDRTKRPGMAVAAQ